MMYSVCVTLLHLKTASEYIDAVWWQATIMLFFCSNH